MNRNDFQQLADIRVKEAKVLVRRVGRATMPLAGGRKYSEHPSA